jgi:hypothetical protein
VGEAAAPDLGVAMMLIFFWVRSLNLGNLEYPQVKGALMFYAIRRMKSFVLSGHAGEAETINSEDKTSTAIQIQVSSLGSEWERGFCLVGYLYHAFVVKTPFKTRMTCPFLVIFYRLQVPIVNNVQALFPW